MAGIATRLARVRRRIAVAADRAGREPATVCLVAVGKTHDAEALSAAVAAGIDHLGENRVQEAAAKRPLVGGATWHLIGPLQRNKARLALETFDLIQTVDRLALVERLQGLLEDHWPGRRLPILIEVNLAGEDQKAGVPPDAAGALITSARSCPQLELRGLMAIPPWQPDAEASRPYFRRLRELRDQLEQLVGAGLPELSMGMSHDFEAAIAEGATMVRVGTAIFGSRA